MNDDADGERNMPSGKLSDAILSEDSQRPLTKYRIERLQRLRERARKNPDFLSDDDVSLLRALEFYHALELRKIELQLEIARDLSASRKSSLERRRSELRVGIPDTPEWREAWKNIRAREWAEKLDDWQSELDVEIPKIQLCEYRIDKYSVGTTMEEWAEDAFREWMNLHSSDEGDPVQIYCLQNKQEKKKKKRMAAAADDGSILPLIFLNALPAGGKSEIRRFLENTDPDVRRKRFHVGEIVSLDDYPYVHFMRRIDEELNKIGYPGMFFALPDRGFIAEADWSALIRLVNDDYNGASTVIRPCVAHPRVQWAYARWLFDRIDYARIKVGILRRMASLPEDVITELATKLDSECHSFYDELCKTVACLRCAGKTTTTIIEFSRGAPTGAEPPFAPPLGYAHSYSEFEISTLVRASVLYVRVSPEMSRAKVHFSPSRTHFSLTNVQNIARALGEHSSVPSGVELMTSLAHRVPDFVMYNSYGADDFVNSSGARHNTLPNGGNADATEVLVPIPKKFAVPLFAPPLFSDGTQVSIIHHLPLAIFDNFDDKTTFARRPVDEWTEQMKAPLERELERALGYLDRKWSETHKKSARADIL